MEVLTVNGSFESDRFWNAMKIYYQHPKSINKEVLFSEDVFIAELKSSLTLNKCQDLFNYFCAKLTNECNFEDSTKNSSEIEVLDVKEVENVFLMPNKKHLLVRKLIPKLNVNDELQYFEFLILDKITTKVYIFTKNIGEISLESQNMKKQDPFSVLKFNFLQLTLCDEYLAILYDKHLGKKGISWLNATFAPKFQKLLLNVDMCQKKSKNSNQLEFDNRVDIVEYYKFYEKMKLKYAKYFVENWTENTDPKKFVYEDIGISTYLLMLWNGGQIPDKNSKKQKFIDLGCGNGLLVHILNSEGHLGVGMDMRKRKIWDSYPSTTVLEEQIIIPTSKTTYPEADWLIGNHSDELTAWIPIMARLSNNHCQYFVLPCCPYQLNGMKFQRKNSSISSYQDYINYVKQISQFCKFETHVDKLRIPSTKRICLIGLNKSENLTENYSELKDKIIKFIGQECQAPNDCSSNKSEKDVTLNFKVRESTELVRNCTKLPQEFIDSILQTVMYQLLKGENICTIIQDGKSSTWNRGRKMLIGELASYINKDMLKKLKSECKGLQTLLKNHHFIFEVSQGFVQFRSPDSMLKLCNKFLESQSELKWKLKKCWFFHNHPDKCPLSDNVCSYSHN